MPRRGESLRVLDLFSGLEGWSGPWRDLGHEVYRVEIDPKFPAEHRDILEPFELPWKPDVVLASPPCTSFSMMSVGKHWTKDNQPKSITAAMGIRLVRTTIELISRLKPKWYVIENPRAKLRTFDEMKPFNRLTVTYCQYGEKRMKPTDLWTNVPLEAKACKNGASCHVAAPRGSRTGTQGTEKHLSAKIPKALSLAVLEAVVL